MNAKNIRILPLDTIRQKAPSVFANAPASHVSENYKFIPTHEILSHLNSQGWDTIAANQQKVRIPGKELGTKHILSLIRRGEDPRMLSIGGLLPTINLVNSHDWSSTFRIVFGMFRLVCENGMLVGGASFASYTLRHDSIMADLEATMARFNSSVNLMLAMAEEWSTIGLDAVQALDMARQAAILRFGDKATDSHASLMLEIRRRDDTEQTLWNVFNRLQENGVKGTNRGYSNVRKARKLTNIQAVTDYNTGLFELAQNTAQRIRIA